MPPPGPFVRPAIFLAGLAIGLFLRPAAQPAPSGAPNPGLRGADPLPTATHACNATLLQQRCRPAAARPPSAARRRTRRPPPVPFADAVLPILREWGCGHRNLEIPRILLPALGGREFDPPRHGRGRFVVDVGLGPGADETFAAVENGFVAFSFEPDAGSVAEIGRKAGERNLTGRMRFVSPEPGRAFDASELPRPPPDPEVRGFAYVFHAALGDSHGTAGLRGSGAEAQVVADPPDGSGGVALLRLDDAVPAWADPVYLLKIDTQGHELKVLRGARRLLPRARYVLYEYSPRLMQRGKLGDDAALLRMLPRMGFLCFDAMGEHLALPRPGRLGRWREELLDWQRYGPGVPFPGEPDRIGPWEDVVCANVAAMLKDRSPDPR
ncbi:S-adenosyl-L-methionine-dependent methyltransferase [Hyaloraphidium curvatum]|nr:S-adenosyl-L-methionine-dependent methyltransferase [Hyaloraphidium curvatum]